MMTSNKELLAKLLATENINVEHRKCETAAFDLKNRTLILPIWRQELSNDVHDLLIGHEVGHALFTPEKEWTRACKKDKAAPPSYYNIVEDARIERVVKGKYPGLKKNFFNGYKELIAKDFFGEDLANRVPELNTIDKINVFYKVGFDIPVDFTTEEREFIKRIDKANSFRDAEKIADDIYTYAKEQEQNTQTELSKMAEACEGDGEGESVKGEKGEKGNKGQSDGSGEDDGDGDDGDQMAGNKASKGRGLDSVTDKAWQESQLDLIDKSGKDYEYLTFGDFDYRPVVEDYKSLYAGINKHMSDMADRRGSNDSLNEYINTGIERMKQFKQDSLKSVSYLAREFEMKKAADAHRKVKESKTGVLNVNKLHSYRFDDNIFKKNTIVADGKNHGLIFFIDWSSSMRDVIGDTVKQLLNLTLFCKKVNIPFEVYAFSNEYRFEKTEQAKSAKSSNQYTNDSYCWSHKELDEEIDAFPTIQKLARDGKPETHIGVDPSFKLMNILSSKMRTKEMNDAMNILMSFCSVYDNRYYRNGSGFIPRAFNLSGTPLNSCIAVSENLVRDFSKANDLQIVNVVYLTDGESNHDVGKIENRHGDWSIGSFNSYGTRTIIRDGKTKKTYDFSDESYGRYNSVKTTGVLLDMLHERTGCNVIGFNILSSIPRWIAELDKNRSDKEIRRKMKKDKFYELENFGYTDYYLLPNGGLDTQTGDMDIDSGMSNKKIKTAFLKHNQSRIVNRVLLQKFIDKITG